MSDINQVLLNMLLNGQGGQANVEEMLGDNSDIDPMTRLLVSQALSPNKARQDGSDEIDPDDEEDYTPSRRRRAMQRLRARFEDMQQQIEEMQWQIEEMEAHNDELAAALGACYLCWGEDLKCPECQGKGKPGSVAPDRALFKEWVLPAVKAARIAEPQRLKPKVDSVEPKTKEETQNVG